MKCDVLLFAQLRESLGKDRLTLDLPDGATVADAVATLSKQHAAIDQLSKTLAVAVDQRYESRTAMLKDGCVIALIPPVSGG